MKHLFMVGCLVFAAPLANCKDSTPAATAEPAARASTPAGRFSGKVVETMNAASYTYVLVDTGAKKVWAAYFADKTFTISWRTVHAAVAKSGDLGHTAGTYEASFKGPDGKHVGEKGK